MGNFTMKHNELTAEQFLELGESVNWRFCVSHAQAELTMKNTLFCVSVFDCI